MKNWDFEEGKTRMMGWCAQQDRSPLEVRRKLTQLGAGKEDIEDIIRYLTAEKFLDLARFARSFARGKFRMLGWGRIKILGELRALGVDSGLAWEAMEAEIPEDEYVAAIQKAIRQKERTLSGGTGRDRKLKLLRYLMSRGFESEMVSRVLRNESALD